MDLIPCHLVGLNERAVRDQLSPPSRPVDDLVGRPIQKHLRWFDPAPPCPCSVWGARDQVGCPANRSIRPRICPNRRRVKWLASSFSRPMALVQSRWSDGSRPTVAAMSDPTVAVLTPIGARGRPLRSLFGDDPRLSGDLSTREARWTGRPTARSGRFTAAQGAWATRSGRPPEPRAPGREHGGAVHRAKSANAHFEPSDHLPFEGVPHFKPAVGGQKRRP